MPRHHSQHERRFQKLPDWYIEQVQFPFHFWVQVAAEGYLSLSIRRQVNRQRLTRIKVEPFDARSEGLYALSFTLNGAAQEEGRDKSMPDRVLVVDHEHHWRSRTNRFHFRDHVLEVADGDLDATAVPA